MTDKARALSCKYCSRGAVVILSAHNPQGPIVRSACGACPTHETQARRWVAQTWPARAGPIAEERLTTAEDDDDLTLF
ncbi:hypothetical protein EDD29_0122 [Actinocorallia herbida]|uniref:Uncharacterized protein n=1 Tax=Actinocorallia herbida TaxID=58109 RepID=A0A3N1CMU7_9ACTN|nr:hypothetical protein [Actinocorallia herbida]ROO82641.1 hypothetical protein EDD29_0122 [Actinocorallia herbida]